MSLETPRPPNPQDSPPAPEGSISTDKLKPAFSLDLIKEAIARHYPKLPSVGGKISVSSLRRCLPALYSHLGLYHGDYHLSPELTPHQQENIFLGTAYHRHFYLFSTALQTRLSPNTTPYQIFPNFTDSQLEPYLHTISHLPNQIDFQSSSTIASLLQASFKHFQDFCHQSSAHRYPDIIVASDNPQFNSWINGLIDQLSELYSFRHQNQILHPSSIFETAIELNLRNTLLKLAAYGALDCLIQHQDKIIVADIKTGLLPDEQDPPDDVAAEVWHRQAMLMLYMGYLYHTHQPKPHPGKPAPIKPGTGTFYPPPDFYKFHYFTLDKTIGSLNKRPHVLTPEDWQEFSEWFRLVVPVLNLLNRTDKSGHTKTIKSAGSPMDRILNQVDQPRLL